MGPAAKKVKDGISERTRNFFNRNRELLPNLVLISLDAVRSDHLSVYSYERSTTPRLEALSTRGVVFKQAISTSSWTVPSHASLLTGLYPFGHGTSYRHSRLEQKITTLPRLLKKWGYATGAFVSAPYLLARYGFDNGFDTYDDHMPIKKKRTAYEVNQSALGWLERYHESPFFLFLHYFDAHTPYTPPGPYSDLYDPAYTGNITGENFANGEQVLKGEIKLKEEDRQHLIALYDGAIAYQDEQVGILLEKLSAWGHSENTIVIVTADHGEAFGEHNLWIHGHSLYDELLRIPLIISYPSGIPLGGFVTDQVSIADVMPTILDLMGLPIPESVQGRTLIPLIVKGEAVEQLVFSYVDRFSYNIKKYGSRFDQDLFSLRTQEWKYIWSSRGQRELYHLQNDPKEITNLANRYQEKCIFWHRQLEQAFSIRLDSKGSTKRWLDSILRIEPNSNRSSQ